MADGQGQTSSQGDKNAAELYQQYCASCHGLDLGGGNAQSLVDGIWQFGDGEGYVTEKHSIWNSPPGNAFV